MITYSRLGFSGQCGNQLFQYAMLLGVASKHGYQIRIPNRPHAKKKAGQTELHKFEITAAKLDRLHKQLPIYREKSFEFDPLVFEQGDNIDYQGYYQSYKYFEHCADKVRQEFRFIPEIDHYAYNYVRGFNATVAIHIRRGDYLERPDLFQNLSLDYYYRCLDLLNWRSARLVFSDDIQWCRLQLGSSFHYVETPSHWHDLAVMSKCDAHIISASSFSWWAAYLANTEKVIAPYPWFPVNGPRANWNCEDIYPERWQRVPVS